ncbi:MAG: glycerol kinase GlpK [Anaerolineae bacterium]|nr:glycerol kinase GlpK [Anaerolineae bacterium]
MGKFVLALDQGTTSSRAILFDGAGSIVGVAQQPFQQLFPRPGWVEHNPEDIWESQLQTAQQAISEYDAADQVAVIGITNQRETTIIWDRKTGEPIYNAVVWQCRRTADICGQLKAEGYDQVLQEKTGLITDPYFSGTKVMWLLENVPGARERAERGELAFGTIDTFLLWRLTEGRVHATDVSNASRTLLFNIHTQKWDDEILEHLHIPRSLLPNVRPSSGIFGETTLFGGTVPIGGMAGDQQAATFGQVCVKAGMAKNTYGTGCFLLMNTGNEAVVSKNRLLTTIAWQLSNAPVQYALEGSVFIAGAAVQWLREGIKLINDAAEVEPLAESVPDTGGVYMVPAFVGLGAPYWNSDARGAIVGLTRGSERAHIVRAALESIAYQTRDVAEAMGADSGIVLQNLRVDGGVVRNNFLMQFQADMLGVPVQRPMITETTALGTAYLAGLSTGFVQSIDQLMSHWKVEREFEPTMSRDQREALYAGWKHAVKQVQA